MSPPLQVGQTVELPNNLRVHRYRDSLHVTDVTHAGKRGKTCTQWTVENWPNGAGLDDIIVNLARAQNPAEALEVTRANVAELIESGEVRAHLYVRTAKAAHVAPAGFRPLDVTGPYVHVHVDHDSFSVRDLTDRHNEPMLIQRKAVAKSIAALRAYCASGAIEAGATFSRVWEAIREGGGDAHYFCAMD